MIAESQGGSLIKELRLLKKSLIKVSTASLLTKDGRSSVTTDEDKRKHWLEHFEEVVNCSTNVSEIAAADTPCHIPQGRQ